MAFSQNIDSPSGKNNVNALQQCQCRADEKHEDWTSIDLREFLDADARPSFVVDISRLHNPDCIIYTNPAYHSYQLSNISVARHDGSQKAFEDWVSRPNVNGNSHNFRGLIWTVTTIRQRWRVYTGNDNASLRILTRSDSIQDTKQCPRDGGSVTLPTKPKESNDGDLYLPRKRRRKEIPSSCTSPATRTHDWTLNNQQHLTSSYTLMLRQHDWSKTPLGPMNQWSSLLRAMVNLLICDPNPAVLFWGPSLAGIYNEPYLPLVAGKHPKSLGEPYYDTWRELYDLPDVAKLIDSLWERGYQTGMGTRQDHQMYHLLLNGILEERYFTLGMLPILGDDGSVQGFYEPLTDVTEEHLATRRQLSIQKVSDETAGVQNLNDFFAHTLDALRENKHDIPYCLLYSVVSEQRKDDAQHPPAVDKTDFNFARLEGAIGVRLEDDGKPIALLLEDDNFKRYFQQACQLGEFITFDIPPHLRDDIMEDPGERGFGDAPHRLVLCPITPMTEKTTTALMVLGVNTRAPLVPEYMAFIRSLSRTISASLASVMLLNIASRRTLEAVHGEQVAKGMLNVAPVGAYLITMDGEILYANPTWYELTDYNNYQNEQSPMSWMEAIADDFQDTMRKEWELLVTEHRSRSFEIRLKKEWKGICNVSGEIIRGPSYMLADAAVQTIDGAVYITGCMTDISRQKWAEDREKKRREEAVELKREQENFIDMTSHEMRNPLSAILQSADSIVSTLTAYQKSDFGPNLGTCPDTPKLDFPKAEERIAYAIEAAATIVLCAQHQKRIVDDVLILSKVDANRLEISPVDVQPLALIGQSLRMFAAELESNDAQMETQAEASFQELEVSWVKMDTSRVLQVLINLYTNAIKFTAAGVTRQIQVSLGASRQPPTLEEYGVHWLSTEKGKVKDPTTAMEWGDGEQLYLSFAVQDTGRGMNEEEMKSLFQRFQQASPRTHTQYGGSGLGLYIARLLTNIQGGEIGVVSVPEKGSTFAFYIKVRRSELSAESALDSNEPKFNGFDSMDLSTLAPAKSPSPSEGLEIHVLVVEDNVVNQRVLRRQLQNLDWTVHVANNGQESIDFLKTTQFWKGNEITGTPLTLVLMDVEMPVMNGLMATREIRRLQSDQLIVEHVPIIAITANARMEQVAVTRESGMDDVVSKPFRIPELVAKVKALIGTGS